MKSRILEILKILQFWKNLNMEKALVFRLQNFKTILHFKALKWFFFCGRKHAKLGWGQSKMHACMPK